MKHLQVWICLILGLAIPAAFCLPEAEDVNKIALEYVRSSPNYLDNGGFNETATGTRVGEKICVVVVQYQTRHVGMLQVIGQFVSYVTIDSATLQVVEVTEVASSMDEEPGEPGATEPGDGSDPGEPVLIYPGEESYRYKISFTINDTREMIEREGLEANLTDVLAMLDRAQALLDSGDYEGAANLASEAWMIAEEFIYGPPVEEPALIYPSEEEYRYKISYLINDTREMVKREGLEANLTDVLGLLDRAQILLDSGEYDEALKVALEAMGIAQQFIYGPAVEEPSEEPEKPSAGETPWLYGYVVVFDHEPTPEEWTNLRDMFNATMIAEASVYVDEKYSYWVNVWGVSPDDLEEADGVKDVLAFSGDLIAPGEGQTDIPEFVVLSSTIVGAFLAIVLSRRR
jgi:tetratricopeptide (TPR) repeat protein